MRNFFLNSLFGGLKPRDSAMRFSSLFCKKNVPVNTKQAIFPIFLFTLMLYLFLSQYLETYHHIFWISPFFVLPTVILYNFCHPCTGTAQNSFLHFIFSLVFFFLFILYTFFLVFTPLVQLFCTCTQSFPPPTPPQHLSALFCSAQKTFFNRQIS